MRVEGDRGTVTALPIHAGTVTLDADFTEPAHIFVGGAGTVNVVTAGDETVDFAMPTGSVLPVQVRQVKSAGTTATSLRRVW